MQTGRIEHDDIIECYSEDYEVVLILGTRITLRNVKPDKKGIQRTIQTDYDMVQHQLQDGFYKLKKKEIINKK
jgi:hypothetical protein